MPPNLPSMNRGLQTYVLSFNGKKWLLNPQFLVHFFKKNSGGACFRKFRKGFLAIFHAILFAENEIVHDHWLDKVARDVAREGDWGCIPHRNLETKVYVLRQMALKMHTLESIFPKFYSGHAPICP